MTAPARLIGHVDDSVGYGALLADLTDYIGDCLWPQSVQTFGMMRRHHALASVLGSYTLPIRRATWALNPAGCRPEVVKLVADDYGLPVLGVDKPGAARVRGVSWAEHLRLALLSLPFGHVGFEMLAEIRDRRARLIELSERLPATIANIHVDGVGRFNGITQHALLGSREAPEIQAKHMVWYAREREGAAWWGTSVLRPAFPAWLVSREMLRVHATANRRFGMGVPTIEWEAGTNPTGEQASKAQQLASAARVGDEGGATLPPGAHLRLVGLTGSAPDTLGFLRYLDGVMAKQALAGFLELGSTDVGARALAESFIELFTLAITSEAESIADTATRQGVARLVEWNWGSDEPVPAVQVSEVGAKHDVTAEALKLLLDSGALSADPALEAHIRRMYRLPEREAMRKPAPTARGGTVAVATRRKPAKATQSKATRVRAKTSRPGQMTLPLNAVGDFERLQTDWEATRADLLAVWPDTARDLTDALAEAAAAAVAAGALTDLTGLTVDDAVVAGIVVWLLAGMTPLAGSAAGIAAAELRSVGEDPAEPEPDEDRLAMLAAVFTAAIVGGFAAAAGRKALTMAAPDIDADAVADAVRAHLDDMSTSQTGLVGDNIGAALTAAQTTGRAGVFAAYPDLRYRAVEVNDASQCHPCSTVDGREYDNLAAAVRDYPLGGYVACEGGLRCRGFYAVRVG